MEPVKRYCPECDYDTSQRIEKINSDDPEGMEIYICNRCGESTGYVEDERFLNRMKRFEKNKKG